MVPQGQNQSSRVLRAHFAAEINRIQLVLFGMQKRTLRPCLPANTRILIPAMPELELDTHAQLLQGLAKRHV
jgi:hypothetical protein